MISKDFYEREDRRFCCTPELIENYDKAIADTTKTWICHHKLEEFYTHKELIEMGKYYNVAPEELVFVENKKEHYKWPHKGVKNAAEKNKGREAWNKGLETHWWTNGKENTQSVECPGEGWVQGRTITYSKETLEKMRKAKEGTKSSFKGHKHSEETKKKISENVKKSGCKRGPAFKIYWVEGDRIFRSMRDCARFFEVSRSMISKVVNGQLPTVRGYHIKKIV